ncbi:MAG: hypothetical protein AAGD32_07890 [Planctomycetota bacterium]
MLLLALFLVADLSLFTADPETVAELEKKLDEGAPWVDEFGQPTAGAWEGKVEEAVELVAPFVNDTPLVGEEFDLIPAAWKWDAARKLFLFDDEPRLYVGVGSEGFLPFTPVDGREFLFDGLGELNPVATAVNPYERVGDLGMRYVSHHWSNLLQRYPDGLSRWSTELEVTLAQAGFSGLGPDMTFTSGDTPSMISLVRNDDPRVIALAMALGEGAVACLIDEERVPYFVPTQEVMAGGDSPVKRMLLEALHTESYAGDGDALMKEYDVTSVRQLARASVELNPEDLATARRIHASLVRDAIHVEMQSVGVSTPIFAEAPGFDGLIHRGDVVPEDLEGPIIQIVTLPMAGPGFAGMSEDEAVKRWRAAVRHAREDERIVAVLWGRFWDDPVTGIGPKTDDIRLVQGRAEAAGLWDVTGRPKLSLLRRLNAKTDPTDPPAEESQVDDERE